MGEAKTSPQIEAVSNPSPTYPACAGSCPLPPPASQILSKKTPAYCSQYFIFQKGFLRETNITWHDNHFLQTEI